LIKIMIMAKELEHHYIIWAIDLAFFHHYHDFTRSLRSENQRYKEYKLLIHHIFKSILQATLILRVIIFTNIQKNKVINKAV